MILDDTNRKTIQFAVDDCFDHGFAADDGFVLGEDRKVTADLPQFVSRVVSRDTKAEKPGTAATMARV
jgi:hypothetical protein